MRLICPNCDAEYEVDDAAIPLTGRDVQCSSCGHAWFQDHPENQPEPEEGPAIFGADPAAKPEWEPEAFLDNEAAVAEDATLVTGAAPVVAAESVAETISGATISGATVDGATTDPLPSPEPEPAPPDLPRRSIDESVLAVLREEAEREAAARRGERPRLETQTEMTLPETPRPPPQVEAPKVEAPKVEVPEPSRKRKLLPAIEEIKSSLHPTPEVDDEEEARVPETQGGSFRTGFVFAVLIAVIILGLYVMAPVIVAKVPALRGPMVAYVQTINNLRAMLDHQVQGLIGWLKGLAGGSAG